MDGHGPPSSLSACRRARGRLSPRTRRGSGRRSSADMNQQDTDQLTRLRTDAADKVIVTATIPESKPDAGQGSSRIPRLPARPRWAPQSLGRRLGLPTSAEISIPPLCPVYSRRHRILVTGAAGFIGSQYVRAMLSGNLPDSGEVRVTVLDKLAYRQPGESRPGRDSPQATGSSRAMSATRASSTRSSPVTTRSCTSLRSRMSTARSRPRLPSSPRTCSARRCCSTPPDGTRSAGSCTSRPTRYTGRSRPAPGRRTHAWRRIRRIQRLRRPRICSPWRTIALTASTSWCTRVFEQLRASPVPREGHPAVVVIPTCSSACGSRCYGDGGNIGATWWLDHSPGHPAFCGCGSGRAGRRLPHRRRHRADEQGAHRAAAQGFGTSWSSTSPDRKGHDRRYSLGIAKIKRSWATHHKLRLTMG